MKYKIIIFLFFGSQLFAQLPEEFVYVQDEIPTIHIELRYFSNNNFIGKPIDGYKRNVLILSKDAAIALKKVQNTLNKKGFGLKIYDAYRPQRAVNHFWKWALNVNDTLMKQRFYPNVAKNNLFKEGYIAAKSGHTRGSTVDLTIVDLETSIELDMGSPYDYFGKESWVEFKGFSTQQKQHRNLLQEVMLSNGFKNYKQEWWHFTLINEPYPDTYFDFVIE